jgi:ABC-type antimicrobial peptide transport system permease subunit
VSNSLTLSKTKIQSKKKKKRSLSLTLIVFSTIGMVLILVAILAPWIAPHDPNVGVLDNRLKPPFWQDGGSTEFLLGTDTLGRDILSRIFGARTAALSLCPGSRYCRKSGTFTGNYFRIYRWLG